MLLIFFLRRKNRKKRKKAGCWDDFERRKRIHTIVIPMFLRKTREQRYEMSVFDFEGKKGLDSRVEQADMHY